MTGWLDRRALKASVREKLRGRLLVCFLACLIPMILPWLLRLMPTGVGVVYFLLADSYIVGVSVPMTLLSFVATALVTDPMQVRVAAYFLNLRGDEEKMPSPLTVCDCFGPDYGRQMGGMLLRTLYMGLFTVPFFATGLLLPGAVTFVEVEGLRCAVLNVSPVFVLLGSLGWLYTLLTSSMTRYVLVEDASATAFEALRRSRRLVHGRLLEMLTLEITFLPWMAIVLFTFIPAVFIYPYYEGTFAAYFRAMTSPAPKGDAGGEDADAA